MELIKRKLTLALAAAAGAIAPDILILYTKRWTMPSLTFDLWMYVVATILYIGLAAVVAMIYPFRKTDPTWKAFILGVTLPIVLSGLASVQHGVIIAPRGSSIEGSLLDMISLF